MRAYEPWAAVWVEGHLASSPQHIQRPLVGLRPTISSHLSERPQPPLESRSVSIS